MTRSQRTSWRAIRLPLLALAAASAVVVGHDSYRPPGRPASVRELVDQLRQRRLCLHVVPVSRMTQDLDDGAFLCAGERPWRELNGLRLPAANRGDWAGVVQARPWPANDDTVAFLVQDGQTDTARVGDVLLFGDPQLLRRIVAALGADTAQGCVAPWFGIFHVPFPVPFFRPGPCRGWQTTRPA
jgi:hypothetical protein